MQCGIYQQIITMYHTIMSSDWSIMRDTALLQSVVIYLFLLYILVV